MASFVLTWVMLIGQLKTGSDYVLCPTPKWITDINVLFPTLLNTNALAFFSLYGSGDFKVNPIDGLMQKRHDSSALAMKLYLFSIKPSL